jgi:allantoin racemase
MNIMVINPNSSEAMTQMIAGVAGHAAGAGVELSVIGTPGAPLSIEGYHNGIEAAYALIRTVEEYDGPTADGVVVACFDDTGVDGLRELLTGPVIGIGEAAMHAASMISSRFLIITAMARSIPILEDNACRYGLIKKCCGVYAFDRPVLSFEANTVDGDYQELVAQARSLIRAHRADALILGCGGMAHLRQRLMEDVKIPVIEGVGVGVQFIRALLSVGLGTSKTGPYDRPTGTTHPMSTATC